MTRCSSPSDVPLVEQQPDFRLVSRYDRAVINALPKHNLAARAMRLGLAISAPA